jgi:CheY-like chemotaxis protein
LCIASKFPGPIAHDAARFIAMAAAGTTRREPLIMVVEDQDDGRDLLREAFEEQGFAVVEASNGKAALELMRAAPPDLVVLDLEMPVMSGREVVDEMAADEALSALPVLVFTGNGRTEVPLDGPVVRRLSKPCSLARLLDAVSECLALSPRNLLAST